MPETSSLKVLRIREGVKFRKKMRKLPTAQLLEHLQYLSVQIARMKDDLNRKYRQSKSIKLILYSRKQGTQPVKPHLFKGFVRYNFNRLVKTQTPLDPKYRWVLINKRGRVIGDYEFSVRLPNLPIAMIRDLVPGEFTMPTRFRLKTKNAATALQLIAIGGRFQSVVYFGAGLGYAREVINKNAMGQLIVARKELPDDEFRTERK